MDIRRADVADALKVATVHVRSWQATYRGLVPQDYLDDLDVELRASFWRTILGRTEWPWTGTLVVLDPEDVVGFINVCPSRDEQAPPSVGEVPSSFYEIGGWQLDGGVKRDESRGFPLDEVRYRRSLV